MMELSRFPRPELNLLRLMDIGVTTFYLILDEGGRFYHACQFLNSTNRYQPVPVPVPVHHHTITETSYMHFKLQSSKENHSGTIKLTATVCRYIENRSTKYKT